MAMSTYLINTIVMRWHEISEAPIADISISPDIDDPKSSWRRMWFDSGNKQKLQKKMDASAKSMARPGYLKKVKDYFGRSKHDYNVYLINSPDYHKNISDPKFSDVVQRNISDSLLQAGIFDPKDAVKLIPELEEHISKTDNVITIVLTHNYAPVEKEYIPLTPWMVAHRFAHILLLHIPEDSFVRKENIKSMFNKLKNKVYDGGNWDYMELIYEVCTMKSARNKTMSDDVHAESFAQYIITGRIPFNPLPTEGIWRDRLAPDVDLDAWNEYIEYYGKNLEAGLHELLDRVVGKVCIF